MDGEEKREKRGRGEDRYREKIKELELVWKLNEEIVSFTSLPEFLQRILEGAVEVMGATSGSIMLIDPPGGDTLRIKASFGLRREVVEKAERRVGEGIAGLVAERREGMLLLDDLLDPRLRTRRKVTDALSVPIAEEGELLGVLNLNTRRDRAFDELDLFLLNALTRLIASAIARGRRIEAARLELRDLETVAAALLEEIEGLQARLDERRRQYQRVRMKIDDLGRLLSDLSRPVG
ncbi:MAG: GAF domain-containing protein [Actinomycetota bacterium]|nr:GAF domain-containing protein [Actinomycetota bacterium]